MQQLKDLRLLCSTAPIILVETHEENRVMELFDHLFKGNLKTRPAYSSVISVVMAERVRHLREWAKNRTVLAS